MPEAPSRRGLLSGLLPAGGLALAGAALAGSAPLAAPLPDGLGALARRGGRFYGAATSSWLLERDPAFARAFAAECGMIVPESEGKWDALRPGPGRFDFSGLERLLAFAGRNDLAFRGHCLVWHAALPGWVTDALRNATPDAARGLLEDHIAAVVGRTRGRAQSWDVVNEAIDVDAGPDGLRRTPWLEALGPAYIDIAFRAARRADPDARLVYNDYGTDAADPPSRRKRAAVLALLRGLRERGVPVDALGIQAHLTRGDALDAGELRAYAREAGALGLEVYVTELDVWEARSAGSPAERDAAVAGHVRDFLIPVLDEPAVRGVLTWGLSNRYSWLTSDYAPWARRADGSPNRGLPLDGELRRTPVWDAVAGALDRSRGAGGRRQTK